MRLNQEMEQYLAESQEELRKLIRDLCAIPAPSHHEEQRAAFCKRWLEENGGENVEIDEALNVICPYGVTEDNDVVVFMAHTDTVFPDREPLPFREEDGKYFSPAVCDDTANLAVLLICARYFLQRKQPAECGLAFVANSCEEGLGNLKGSRAIVKRYGSRLRELITLDGVNLNALVNRAVGSHRYRVTVRTEGGHSFGAFGNRNAIRCLASMIDTLYTVKVPEEEGSKTTYNVGLISGGTSVNTIAQEAEMLYEYRSDSKACLEKMRAMFEQVTAAYRATGIGVEVELIGERPCAGELDPVRYQALMDRAAASIRTVLNQEACFRASSTDCNIPLSVGIPAVCMSACTGAGCHTREEYLNLDSLPAGSRLFMDFLASYFEG